MPLQSPDEGRYAESARAMLETGDWLIPHYAYVERVNKPPLFYWAAAAAMRLIGVNEVAARLPSLLAAIGIVLILYLLGRAMWDQSTGQAAALVVSTSLLFAALARTAITDMLLGLCLTASVAAFAWAIRGRSLPATLLFFAAAAAGTLTKGPIALALPILIALAYLALSRQWRQVHWGAVIAGVLLYAALAAPWFAAVQARYSGFLHYFLIGENLQRFGGNDHPEPVWFYVPVLMLGLGVWLPSLFPALLAALRPPRMQEKGDPNTLLALLWFGGIFAFYSFSKGKLPTYLLPCFPPLALLIGRYWTCASAPSSTEARRTRLTAILVAAGLACAAFVANGLLPRLAFPAGGDWEQAGRLITVAMGSGAVLVAIAALRTPCTQFGAIAAAGALLTLGAADAASYLLAGDCRAAVQVARRMAGAPPETRVYAYREGNLTALRFYLGRSLGSSRRLRDIPAPERPAIDGVPRAGRRRIARRGAGASAAELAEALREPGPVIVVIERLHFERVRPMLAHVGADGVLDEIGKHVVVGRLTSGPLSGKSPDREPAAKAAGLKDR